MSKPVLDLSQHADEAFYTFIGRVSLLLVEQNVDAITATMFLRELVEAGGSTLRVEQAMVIAQNYVECAIAPPQEHDLRQAHNSHSHRPGQER